MAIQYRVYTNDGLGGPIDYSTPLATLSGLNWTSAALPVNARRRYAVRAYDTVTGLEEGNLDARVDLTLDASGNDVSGRPAAPFALTATPTSSTTARAKWAFLLPPDSTPPTGFKVWATVGGTVNYAASPAGTVAYVDGQVRFVFDLSGLTSGATYTVGVRATNAAGDEVNTLSATFVVPNTAPNPVDGLVANVVTGSGPSGLGPGSP